MKIPPLKYLVPGTVAGLLLAYTGIGFLAVPALVKSQAAQLAAEKLHRQLSIEEVTFNPFTLSASVRGLKMMEPDGSTVFASFERLAADLSWQSVARLAPVVQEVRLTKPYVHLSRSAANKYNIDDILQLAASQPPSPEPARFSVNNIQLEEGSLAFEDKPAGVTHKVQDLKLGLPFVSSLPSDVAIFVEPLFSANINGSPLLLKGKARPFTEPKEYALDLKLDKVDLTTYLGYLPFKPGFRLPSAQFDAQLNLAVVQPKDKPASLTLGGEASLTGVQLQQLDGKQVGKLDALKVKLGKLDLLAQRYEIAQVGVAGLELDVLRGKDGKLNLDQLAPAAPQAAPAPAPAPAAPKTGPLVVLKELNVTGAALRYADDTPQAALRADLAKFGLRVQDIVFDGAKRTLDIAAVTSESAEISVHQGKTSGKAPAKAGAPAKDEAPLQIKLGKLAINEWSAKVREEFHDEPTLIKLSPLSLTMEGYSSAPGATAEVALSTGINKGQLDIKGQLAPAPFKADLALDLKNFDLLPLQPYVTDYVNLRLVQGAVTSKARLRLDTGKDGAVTGGYKGDVSVNRLSTVDKSSSNDFLSWKSLAFGGMDVNFKPFTLNIERVALDDFFARVIIDPNGRINVQDVVRKEGEEGKSLTEAGTRAQEAKAARAKERAVAQAPAAPAVAPAKPAEPLPPIRIGKLVLSGGRVRFTDNFIKPNYTANLKDLGGTVTRLSSNPAHDASVDLRGQVSGAPLLIAGRVHPLKQEFSLDLRADVRGMELSQLSAYSDKYVGYGIEKGKMTFEVAYQLENRQLKAENRLLLDQLTFGKESTNPEATKLPVQLAVALLSDRNGVIDINVPIGGSLDDPQFSVGGIILKVIGNAITKTVTAPFALIGALFGGGEELSMLEFDKGRAVLLPASEGKLKSLAKALTERPGLKLDVTGRFDEEAESEALKRVALERKLRQLKTRDLQARGAALPEGGVVVAREEQPALLARAYKDETFTKPRNALGLVKSLPPEEMEKLMLANIKFEQDDFITLANRRAQAAKDWLVGQGQVAPERIFLVAPKAGAASRVDFALH
ncbi:DUF748 domain-containing protein [Pseudoduganella sp. DS3]|uniref:DUF748 domain-containing protein n=1 Tax=Pseudoduganella guangdongensis TaxID=2692179 RepID=A0A6N9HLI5_9BURK|nr:DUF748 domain-containing protein [Pseudoduganella guangdongensis]MYN04370.1 DUF748 domain-containing protein [Pseudoduganella guangdongensis]